MRIRLAVIGSLALLALAAGAVPAAAQGGAQAVTLLNVSYDPTRELYEDFNQAVRRRYWKGKTGQTVTSASRTAARASRPARSSTAWRPTW